MHFLITLANVRDDQRLAELGDRLLGCVVDHNIDLLLEHPEIPPLYKSGVRFRPEPWAIGPSRLPDGLEQFCPIPQLLERGWGDCAQLCAWRVAELRAGGWRTPDAPRGESATLRYYVKARCPQCGAGDCPNYDHPKRQRSYHVEMRRADRRIEDPSQLLAY